MGWSTSITDPQTGETKTSPLFELFKTLIQYSFPHYEGEKYTRIPVSFLLLAMVYLENSASRPPDCNLITQIIEAATNLLNKDLEGAMDEVRQEAIRRGEDPEIAVQQAGGLMDSGLRAKCLEMGFLEHVDHIIERLQSVPKSTGTVEACLAKVEEFRGRYFPEQDDIAGGWGGDDVDPMVGGGLAGGGN